MEKFNVYFYYNNKKYPFDLNLFEKRSDYFSKENMKENEVINLVDQFDSFQIFTEESINDFICQNEITNSNVLQLNFLAKKYHDTILIEITDNYIKENHKQIFKEYILTQINKNQESKSLKNNFKNDDDNSEENNFNISRKNKKKVDDNGVKRKSDNDDDEEKRKNDNDDDDDEKRKNDNDDDDDEKRKNDNDDDDENRKKDSNNDDENDDTTNKQVKSPRRRKKIKKSTKNKKNQKQKKNSKKKKETEKNNEDDEKIDNKEITGIADEIIEINGELTEVRYMYVPEIYESIISENFREYVSDLSDILLLFRTSTLYRIMTQFSIEENQQNDESDIQIVTFLFQYVVTHGKESTLLLSILDFGKKGTEYFNDQLNEFYDYVDTKFIQKKMFQNYNFLYKKQQEEFSSLLNDLKTNNEKEIQKLNEKVKTQKEQIQTRDLIIFSNFNNLKIPDEILTNSLSKFAIPSTISKIEKENFADCTFLQEITIPSSVSQIEENAFDGCTSLIHVEIPPTVQHIGNNAFNKCENLTDIKIDLYATQFEDNTFNECPLLNHIIISTENENISENGFQQLFQKFDNITKISFSYNITQILDNVFAGCSSLTQIIIPESVTKIGNNAFAGCSSLAQIIIPELVTEIGNNAFAGCSSLTQIIIPESVTKIGNNAFVGCSSLAGIIIPESVTKIGSGCFKGCSSLSQINIPPLVDDIGNEVFLECSSLQQIEILSTIKHIGNLAFSGCNNLTNIMIDIFETQIENDAFNECPQIEHVLVSSNIEVINENDFQPFLQKFDNAIQISFLSNITQILNKSFYECSKLKKITIPSSVTTIGNRAFSNCTSLTEISFEDPSSLISIGKFAFYECSSLKQIIIPPSVTEIMECTFYGCISLEQITIPSSIKSIGESSFYGCSLIEQIEIPSSVEKISANAFSECSSLKEITIPSSVTQIANYHFERNASIENIKYSVVIEIFKKSIFYQCSSLKKINFLNSEIFFDRIIDIDEYRIDEPIVSNRFTRIYKYAKIGTDDKFIFKAFPSVLLKNMREFENLINSYPKNINGIIDINYKLPFNEEDIGIIYDNGIVYSNDNIYDFLDNIIIVTKFMNNGSVLTNMKQYFIDEQRNNINPTVRTKIIFGVATIMKKLHEKNIINIDLNYNIYLDDNFEPQIAIFSLYKYLGNNDQNHEYVAPENYVDSNSYEKPADVYSFAIFLYKFFTRNCELPNPFNLKNLCRLRIINNERPNRPDNIPDNYWNIINQCWNANPYERLTFEEICNILKNDEFAINEFGMSTDLNSLHEYQNRIEQDH